MAKKMLVFDMDGTIADLYGVENWLKYIEAEDTTPYETATPLYNMNLLNFILNVLKNLGWEIIVTTWLAKNGSVEYNNRIKKAKTDWLNKYHFPYDKLNIVEYGTPKTICTKEENSYQILIDDDENVRKEWTLGATIDASANNIIFELTKLAGR